MGSLMAFYVFVWFYVFKTSAIAYFCCIWTLYDSIEDSFQKLEVFIFCPNGVKMGGLMAFYVFMCFYVFKTSGIAYFCWTLYDSIGDSCQIFEVFSFCPNGVKMGSLMVFYVFVWFYVFKTSAIVYFCCIWTLYDSIGNSGQKVWGFYFLPKQSENGGLMAFYVFVWFYVFNTSDIAYLCCIRTLNDLNDSIGDSCKKFEVFIFCPNGVKMGGIMAFYVFVCFYVFKTSGIAYFCCIWNLYDSIGDSYQKFEVFSFLPKRSENVEFNGVLFVCVVLCV